MSNQDNQKTKDSLGGIAPISSVSIDLPEPSTQLEPLQPLENDLGDALSNLLETTLQPQIPQQEHVYVPPQIRRPIPAISTELCPKGLAGICVICPEFPCQYMKKRVLRALLAEAEYSKP